MSLKPSFGSPMRELGPSGEPEIADHSTHFAITRGLSNFKSLLAAICYTIKYIRQKLCK